MTIESIFLSDRTLLLDRLLGRVFHMTTAEAYKEILKSGEISNNETRRFTLNASSENSYGRIHGHVCLFDLRHHTPEIIQKTLECYYFLGPSWFTRYETNHLKADLVYLTLSPQFYDQIIPNLRAREHYQKTGEYLQAIPGTEVWISGGIPLSWIENTLMVKIEEPGPDETDPAGMYFLAALEAGRMTK